MRIQKFQIRQSMKHRSAWRTLLAGMAVLVLAVATVAAGPGAPKASAAGSNCRHYVAEATFPVTDKNGTYFVSAINSTPSWSACRDINVESIIDPGGIGHECANMRVRFFVNGGSKLYNDFHWVCKGGRAATGVSNNAAYRIEVLAPTKVGIFD